VFSSRLRSGGGRNRLTLALDERRSAGLPVVDLTESNPTRAGFSYPRDLLQALGHERALRYDPSPFGLWSAREAAAGEFRRRGATVPPERIVLTTSTSEAYSVLFKLLCDAGDAVLMPRPSYPLIEHLTELDGVRMEPYSLDVHGRWSLDLAWLRRRLESSRAGLDGQDPPYGQPRVRAIIIISPNNPTGSVVTAAEMTSLAALAREHGVALISDEVFADYSMDGARLPSVLDQHEALSFGLGGLSKSAGLPQLKLGWIGVAGPDALVTEAMDRLETICDAYLSVATPVQAAAPELIRAGEAIRAQIQQRVRGNCRHLLEIAAEQALCSVLPVEAGWYAVVQVPAVETEETLALGLLARTGVLVHPGYFFDFEREAFLVLSLLPDPAVFASGVAALLGEIGRRQ
jgi:alanine-synthesizing transaminase